MDNSLISLFIDDEMNLDEKIVFVETVRQSRQFSLETIELLEQEKQLRELPVQIPASVFNGLREETAAKESWSFRSWWKPMAGFAVAMLVAGLVFLLMPRQSVLTPQTEQRFVLYLPQTDQAKIVGTFTGWNPLPMHQIGSSGYWSLTLKLPPGEYRYSYIVEKGKRMADPTISAREHDDFGGENSVLVIGGADDPVS